MKAWIVSNNDIESCEVVFFAKTRDKAKAIALQTDGCGIASVCLFSSKIFK